MAKVFFFSLAIFLIFVIAVDAQVSVKGKEGSLRLEDCPKACEYRCSATSHKKPCLFFCNYCCHRCLCVPSGTEGNRQECPCYDNIKTKEGKNKCP